jgi:hypothetical protein
MEAHMADPATKSVAPEDGTTTTSARYGAGPPIVLADGAFQHCAFAPSAAGLPKLPGAGFKVFHVPGSPRPSRRAPSDSHHRPVQGEEEIGGNDAQ